MIAIFDKNEKFTYNHADMQSSVRNMKSSETSIKHLPLKGQ